VLRQGWVLLNCLLFLVPAMLFLLSPMEGLQFGVVWLLFGFSGLFFLSAKIVRKILQPLEDLSGQRT